MLMSSQTMAQARRTRLKRALTEVTSDTVSYVRTVGNQSQIKHNTLLSNFSSLNLSGNDLCSILFGFPNCFLETILPPVD